LKVLAHDGKPEPDALVTAFTSAGEATEPDELSADEDGVVTLPLRFFRGDPLSVEVERHLRENRILCARWEGSLPPRHVDAMDAEVTLPPPDEAIEFDDFKGPADNSAIGIARPDPPPPDERGTLEVRAVRWTGEPAAGADIDLTYGTDKVRWHFARLDADGIARFEAIAAGAWNVVVAGPGLLRTRAEAQVPNGTVVRITLTEPTPGAASVRVVDPEGTPIPFALLALTAQDGFPVDWHEISDGVQRVDRFTDHDGTRRLPHLPPGPLRVRARYGGRSGEATCEIVAGEIASVTVRVEAR
jgi:hypothetical protein